MNILRGIVARLSIGLVVLAAIGIGYQQWGERRDAKLHPMPGVLVDVGDHRLHIRFIGRGYPTVLMMAGAGSPSVNSYDLQNEIAAFTRVCSYDRAGLGWSDAPTQTMSLSATVEDLNTLLARSGEKGPFVLVPESFGGMVALTFVEKHPDAIVGIVAVDASEPQSWYQVSGPMRTGAKARNIVWQAGWRVGLIRLLFDSQAPPWVAGFSPLVRKQFKAVWTRPMASFANDWIDAYDQTSIGKLPPAPAGLLGERPLIVISHGRATGFLTPEFEAAWPKAQAKWLALSNQSERLVASENGHMIAQENPYLVATAVARVVARIRNPSGSLITKPRWPRYPP